MRFPGQNQILTKRETPPPGESSRLSLTCPSGGGTSTTTNGDAVDTSVAPGAGALLVDTHPEPSNNAHACGAGGGSCARRRGQLAPPFDVRRDPARPQRGRGVFAVEAVPAGTEVMVARLAAAVPRDQYRAAFCRRCLTLLDKKLLIKCRRCEDRFCGKECVIAAAGEGTHEATCAFVEGLGDLEKLEMGGSAAATQKEILRLTVECLARRGAGLSDEEEWVEIEDLDLGAGVGEKYGAGCPILDAGVIREAQARLISTGVEVSAEEVQTLYRR